MNNSVEKWKDIEGYEGIYMVSDRGNIKSLDRFIYKKDGKCCLIRGVVIQLFKTKRGYMQLILHNAGSQKRFFVHRLVAMAFIENPENKEEVNHKNGIKHDNSVHNLEWATRIENHRHASVTGLLSTELRISNAKQTIKKAISAAVLVNKKIDENVKQDIRENYQRRFKRGEKNKWKSNLDELAAKHNIDRLTVSQIANHFGFYK